MQICQGSTQSCCVIDDKIDQNGYQYSPISIWTSTHSPLASGYNHPIDSLSTKKSTFQIISLEFGEKGILKLKALQKSI